MFEPSVNARINHVAMSVPAEWLDEARRDEIVDFYHEVFGWNRAESGEESNPLLLSTHEWGDFIYIYPSHDDYMVTPRLDHFGFRVATMEELDDTLDRAKKRAASDDRVSIIEKKTNTQQSSYGPVTLTNCYVSFLLPLMVELQHIVVEQGADAG